MEEQYILTRLVYFLLNSTINLMWECLKTALFAIKILQNIKQNKDNDSVLFHASKNYNKSMLI